MACHYGGGRASFHSVAPTTGSVMRSALRLIIPVLAFAGAGIAPAMAPSAPIEQVKAAALLGSAAAQHALALRYALGDGVPRDYGEALRWYRSAAEQGYAASQYYLGAMYEYGVGVAADYGEAVRWYRFAALQGHSGAQVNLGTLYYQGKGVTQDYGEALRWVRLAAAQGDPQALITLGLVYREGKGVTPDPVQAYKWLSLAAMRAADAEGREQAAGLRDTLARQMNAEQIAAAQRFVREWRPLASQRFTPVAN